MTETENGKRHPEGTRETDQAFGYRDDSPGRAPGEKVRAAIAACGFLPTHIDTSCVDAPEDTEVDGIPVVGRTWVSRGVFYVVRRAEG